MMDELQKATLDPEYKEYVTLAPPLTTPISSFPLVVRVVPPTAKKYGRIGAAQWPAMPATMLAVNVAPVPIVEHIAPAPAVSCAALGANGSSVKSSNCICSRGDCRCAMPPADHFFAFGLQFSCEVLSNEAHVTTSLSRGVQALTLHGTISMSLQFKV